LALAFAAQAAAPASNGEQLRTLKVTVLSTMLADKGIGEWGFAALLEGDGHRILIDTGARPTTVLSNAVDLGVDLTGVHELVLTHNHEDHTGGLVTLRRELMKKSPAACSLAHAGRGIFYERPGAQGQEQNSMIASRKQYQELGGRIVEHDTWAEIVPGVWITGPVPRVYSEQNSSANGKMRSPDGLVQDNVPEDITVVANTPKGLVLVTGCGHAGIVNILTHVEKRFPKTPVCALIGGIHLFDAPDDRVDWTASKLKDFQVLNFIGAHCTGINTVFELRGKMGLSRKTAVVGAVGTTFDLASGINPGWIAQ
jgi:7,8-dihydropterin-6-yl-methyl-4-(beta-D-ribofuranosyl)aminobenzene 5'-phosphate synthase